MVILQAATVRLPAKFLPPSTLRKLRGSEQVAAVCFRLRGESVEFLLVRTRGGRWTFPKGCAEPGLTHAQAAALEAFEEAGVHGRMEESSFGGYVLRGKNKAKGLAVNAYMCEVSRQVSPEETKRKPTWFSPQDCKKRLREGRSSSDSSELSGVVDCALSRINALSATRTLLQPGIYGRDALRRVPFEARELPTYRSGQVLARGGPSAMKLAVNEHLYRMLQLNFTQGARSVQLASRPVKKLLEQLNPPSAMAPVVEIDRPNASPNKARISTRKTHRNRPTID